MEIKGRETEEWRDRYKSGERKKRAGKKDELRDRLAYELSKCFSEKTNL